MNYFKTALCCTVLSVMAVDTLHGQVDPQEPLDRRVGTWVNKSHQKVAGWTPKEDATTGEETIKWVLDKKFIQGDVIHADGSKGHWLMNYDTESEVYRTWFFGNRGEFPGGETVGRWDPKAERMIWRLDLEDGLRGEMTFQFTGNDKLEWTLTIHDSAGKLMLDNGGSQTRKK